jgi:hypothetical protein
MLVGSRPVYFRALAKLDAKGRWRGIVRIPDHGSLQAGKRTASGTLPGRDQSAHAERWLNPHRSKAMKLRHASALALVGWYLMVPSPSCAAGGSQTHRGQESNDSQVRGEIENEWYLMCPPFTSKPSGVAVNAPFTQWRLGTHWPDREACEKQRAGVAQLAMEKFATSADEHLRTASIAMQHCLCFSSNDQRLDQKSVRETKDEYLDQAYREGLLKSPPK